MYVLLVANVIFYLAAGFDQFLVLLLATAVSYVVACKMGKLHEKLEKQKQEEGLDRKQIKRMKANNKKQRKRILIWGLVLNIGILVVFKYTNFLLKTGYSILDLFGIGHGDDLFKLIMPLGISFFTFQILSYLIDVYKGKVKAQKNFLKYLLYISFFPSVVQGPIPRYADLGTQLYEEHRFEYDNLRDGALLILWGFAKKLILAERLGTFVDQIYGNYTQYTGMLFFFVATAAFSIQIYADFSGCMDIATGTARLFGIRLAPNFLRPYFSKTMPEFWRRWHVTLGNWFKDYVFYPISISKFSLDLNKKAIWKNRLLGDSDPGGLAPDRNLARTGLEICDLGTVSRYPDHAEHDLHTIQRKTGAEITYQNRMFQFPSFPDGKNLPALLSRTSFLPGR